MEAPEQRREFLDRECAGNAGLRAEVESLLDASRAAGSFLESPAAAPAATIDAPAADETAGTTIGPHKLIEPVGEGGMGAVWMAQQTEPVKRLVAAGAILAAHNRPHPGRSLTVDRRRGGGSEPRPRRFVTILNCLTPPHGAA